MNEPPKLESRSFPPDGGIAGEVAGEVTRRQFTFAVAALVGLTAQPWSYIMPDSVGPIYHGPVNPIQSPDLARQYQASPLRDQFAMAAIAGLMANPERTGSLESDVRVAFEVADFAMEQRRR